MVVFLVIILVVVCVGGALAAYQWGGRSRTETSEQRRERFLGERLERRYQEEERRDRETPPTHDEQ